MIPFGREADIDRAVPSGVTHIGLVATAINGDLLVTEPRGHPYDVSATFSKIKIVGDERPSTALARCIGEQVGHEPTAIYPIPTVWVSANSTGYYFAGLLGDIA